LLHLLDKVDESKLTLKILSFIADVVRTNDKISFEANFCQHLTRESLLGESDLDHIEKFVDCLIQVIIIIKTFLSPIDAEIPYANVFLTVN
jgi:hypothetical protein